MSNLPNHTFIIASLVAALSSCGQKGPLVLPQPQTPQPAVEATAPPATTNEQ